MAKINFEISSGRLGHDPEIKYLKDNTCMAKVSVAVNRYKYNKETKENEQIGIVTWINATAFGYPAELIEAMELSKGDNVFVKGYMYEDEYEDKEGDMVISMEYYIDRLYPIPSTFDDDDKPTRKKKKKASRIKKRKSSGGSKQKTNGIPNIKPRNKKSSSSLAKNVLAQLKGNK